MKEDIQIRAAGVVNGEVFCKCPQCGQTKSINEFGIRRLRNGDKIVIRNQSWCRDCR